MNINKTRDKGLVFSYWSYVGAVPGKSHMDGVYGRRWQMQATLQSLLPSVVILSHAETLKGGGGKYIFMFCIMVCLFRLEFEDAVLMEKVSAGGGLYFNFMGLVRHFTEPLEKAIARWENGSISAISSLTSAFNHQISLLTYDLLVSHHLKLNSYL